MNNCYNCNIQLDLDKDNIKYNETPNNGRGRDQNEWPLFKGQGWLSFRR